MSSPHDANNPGLGKGDKLFGFHVKRIENLSEIDAIFYELVHMETGAKYVHISNGDSENTFGVFFKTVPSDSTGVAHILEHTVLCGSEKFPVRDPFFSMLKRSLNTFMNAFTAADWTMYPFCSQNKKDFQNLMDVYLDAAFFPKIERLNFCQEGHRLETEKTESGDTGLVYKGVVYNEMKGAMSSPDQVLGYSLSNALYPSTTYRFNSGGDPSEIPKLTHEGLKAFHRRHYHPSNAYFYTYGNFPLREHLSFIEEKVMKKFKRTDPKTEVPVQPRWTEPRKAEYFYPLAQNEDPSKKHQVCVAWLMTDITDTFETLAMTLLEHILIGNPASPLHKALIDSGLGSALSDWAGFDPDNRDTLFSCGLKEVEESAGPEIEKIVFSVLNDLAENGIDKELIESAIHQIEFKNKEVTNTPYPYGIKLLLSFTGTWQHGGDPVHTLNFGGNIEKIRAEAEKGEFFENRIRRYFMDNPHRVLFKLSPDQNMEKKEAERVAGELEQIAAGLDNADRERIRNDAEALEKFQEEPEDLACLPTLELSDIPPDVPKAAGVKSDGAATTVCYNQPTAGICYFTAAAGAGVLDGDLIPLVPFFSYAFSRIGTTKRDYVEMARMIDACTGGLELNAHARTGFDKAETCVPYVLLDGKCLVRNREPMFDTVKELVSEFDFSDTVRLKSLLYEFRANLESSVVSNGSKFALSLATRNFSPAHALMEKWDGIHQLKTVKALTDDLSDEKLEALSKYLMSIGRSLFTRNNLKTALIGEEAAVKKSLPAVESLLAGLAGGTAGGFAPPAMSLEDVLPSEGWSTSTSVSFVASMSRSVRMEHEDAPALAVIARLLWALYIHREIREKGGAYGGSAIYNSEEGVFGFSSYRDPHIANTLKVYGEAFDFIRSGKFTDENIKEAVIQVCSGIDRPDPPGIAAKMAFVREILSLSDDTRIGFKKRLLEITGKQVAEVAEKYFGDPKENAVAVISSEDKLKEANPRLPGGELDLYRI